MPGFFDRIPSHVDRPPVSRVGDELQARCGFDADVELPEELASEIEHEAFAVAVAKGWDKQATSHRWRGRRGPDRGPRR